MVALARHARPPLFRACAAGCGGRTSRVICAGCLERLPRDVRARIGRIERELERGTLQEALEWLRAHRAEKPR